MPQDQPDRQIPSNWESISIKIENDSPDLETVSNEDVRLSHVKTEIPEIVKDEKTDAIVDAKPDYSHFSIRPCFVSLHRGVNLKELSSCTRCKEVLDAHKVFPDVDPAVSSVQLSRVKIENSEKIKDEKPCVVIHDYARLSLRRCFVDLHQGVNLQELSLCPRCKKRLNSKLPNCENSDGKGMETKKKKLLEGFLYNDNLDIRGTSDAKEKVEHTAGNNVSAVRNINNESEQQFQRNLSSDPGQSTSGIKIVKCMFRKNPPSKSNVESSPSKCLSRGRLNKEYKCNECERSFHGKKNWIIHLRTHSGEKPYNCNECGRTFTQKANLNYHLRIHSGEKPYNCNECGKTFTQKGSLNYHLRIHSGEKPYNCNECGRTFTLKANLNDHLRIHSGEKPYNCNECGRSFTQKSNLNTHLRIHSGEKPYNCNECGRTFTRNTNLHRHLRIHSGKKPCQM